MDMKFTRPQADRRGCVEFSAKDMHYTRWHLVGNVSELVPLKDSFNEEQKRSLKS
jgi:hypothetical protein